MSQRESGQTKYSSLSLFSGAMGLDIGFEKSGRFETLAVVEADRACCETIRLNRDRGLINNPALRVYERDILKLNPSDVLTDLELESGQLDVLIAGPRLQKKLWAMLHISSGGRQLTLK